MDDFELEPDSMGKDKIISALKKTRGNVWKADQLPGFGRKTLYRKMELLEIEPGEFRV